MSLDFTNATGHLFNRLGAIFAGIKAVQTYQETTVPAYITSITDQFAAREDMTPTIQETLTTGQQSAAGVSSSLAALANSVLLTMIQEDAPQPQKTLDYILPNLIAQMTAATATVEKNVVSASPAAGGSNTGNGTCLASVTNGAGITLENVRAEVLVATCTQDSYPGQSATTGQEQFTARGPLAIDRMDFNWPGGSGGGTSITAASAAVDASDANVLTNGDFESFTVANQPDNWVVTVGVVGTTVKSTTTSYIGTTALSITGTGAELTNVTQTLRSATNAGIIQPQTKYAIAFYLRVSSVPSAGVLRVALKDGVAGSVVGSGSVSITLSGATTGYVLHSVIFNTPLVLPATLVLSVELTTALDNTKSVYIDELVMTRMVQHQNGPFLAIIPGSTPFVRGDLFNITVANNGAGEFQTWFNRIFSMDIRGLVLPSDTSGSETIADSLIA